MPSQYTGLAGNITRQGSLAITGATNATPIVIQTASAHGLLGGETCDVDSVGGNTAANGRWIITVVDATHVSLNGSVGSGAYTPATGVFSPRELQPSYQIPSDGDVQDAASINVALEALGDRTAWLGARVGQFYMLDMNSFATAPGGPPATNAFTITTTSSYAFTGLEFSWASGGGHVAFDPIPGDIVQSQLVIPWTVDNNLGIVEFNIQRSFGGLFGSFTPIPTGGYGQELSVANEYYTTTISSFEVVPAGTSGRYALALYVASSAPGAHLFLQNGFAWNVQWYRFT